MKLFELMHKIPTLEIHGSQACEITGLFYDSRKVVTGGVFFALRGTQFDGHRFAQDAVQRGAVAVVAEEKLDLPAGVTAVVVANTREAMAYAAHEYYGRPTEGIPVVGVTGTNGKTTITYLVESILRAGGKRPAVFGTVNYRFGDEQVPSSHTTPESVELLETMARFRAAGADAIILEVSSHALDQYRVESLAFDVGIFTNLTPEHLDYHGDMEHYFASKEAFFTRVLPHSGGRAVINVDDSFGIRLHRAVPEALTCGTTGEAVVRAADVRITVDGIVGTVFGPNGQFALHSPLVGQFNLENILCAAAAGWALNLSPAIIAEGIASATQVPGRLERIENDLGALILVDYAHTGDALEKALSTLKDLSPRRIVTVFGCGGDRDRRKRPVMGEVAARYSDLVVLTSDNPRTEDPQFILDEVRPGIERVYPRELSREEGLGGKPGFVAIADRREAIGYAVKALREGDLLLVAGKGHEDYQIIGREKHHFDDREELRKALKGLE